MTTTRRKRFLVLFDYLLRHSLSPRRLAFQVKGQYGCEDDDQHLTEESQNKMQKEGDAFCGTVSDAQTKQCSVSAWEEAPRQSDCHVLWNQSQDVHEVHCHDDDHHPSRGYHRLDLQGVDNAQAPLGGDAHHVIERDAAGAAVDPPSCKVVQVSKHYWRLQFVDVWVETDVGPLYRQDMNNVRHGHREERDVHGIVQTLLEEHENINDVSHQTKQSKGRTHYPIVNKCKHFPIEYFYYSLHRDSYSWISKSLVQLRHSTTLKLFFYHRSY